MNIILDLFNNDYDWVIDIFNKEHNVIAVSSLPYFTCGRNRLEIKTLENIYEKYEKAFETVIVLDDKTALAEVAMERIIIHMQHKKRIICFYSDFSNEQKEYLYKRSLSEKTDLIFKNNYSSSQSNILEKIDIPVVFVSGMGSNTDKTCTAFLVKKYFETNNKKAIVLSMNECVEMLGGYSISDDIVEHNVFDIVLHINHIVTNLIKETACEVLVVAVPQGIIAMDETITNSFGVINYILAQALRPDLYMFNLYFGDYSIEQIRKIRNMLKETLGDIFFLLGLSHVYFDSYNYVSDKQTQNYISVSSNIYNKFMTILNKKDIFFYDTREVKSIGKVLASVEL